MKGKVFGNFSLIKLILLTLKMCLRCLQIHEELSRNLNKTMMENYKRDTTLSTAIDDMQTEVGDLFYIIYLTLLYRIRAAVTSGLIVFRNFFYSVWLRNKKVSILNLNIICCPGTVKILLVQLSKIGK